MILLYLLTAILSILSVIRHLICGKNLNIFLKLNLIYKALQTRTRSGLLLVDFIAGKTQLVSFDLSNNTGHVDMKMDGSVLEEKLSFKILGLTTVDLLFYIVLRLLHYPYC